MSDNPYRSAQTPGRDLPARSFRTTPVVLVLGVAGVALLVMLLLPARRGSPEAARRAICQNQLKQIALALLNYEAAHGALPPAYTVDELGNRLHSWRTLILPYLEQQALYDQIDLTKPWDDPANAAARGTIVECYLCPSAPYADETLTTYLAVVSDSSAFSGSTGRCSDTFTDGLANTLLVVDAHFNHAVHWMSPTDIDTATLLNHDSERPTHHMNVMNVAFADGHAEALHGEVSREALAAMVTINGGESLER